MAHAAWTYPLLDWLLDSWQAVTGFHFHTKSKHLHRAVNFVWNKKQIGVNEPQNIFK